MEEVVFFLVLPHLKVQVVMVVEEMEEQVLVLTLHFQAQQILEGEQEVHQEVMQGQEQTLSGEDLLWNQRSPQISL